MESLSISLILKSKVLLEKRCHGNTFFLTAHYDSTHDFLHVAQDSIRSWLLDWILLLQCVDDSEDFKPP